MGIENKTEIRNSEELTFNIEEKVCQLFQKLAIGGTVFGIPSDNRRKIIFAHRNNFVFII